MNIKITKKEKQILTKVANGKSNERISKDCGISLSTVQQYIRILMNKIPSDNRAQLVYEAMKNGIID